MAEIVFVKTQYQEELEKVHSRLKEGRQQVADVKNRNDLHGYLYLNMNIGGEKHLVRVIQIGANSFGLEVKISYKGEKEWTALEQFDELEQLAIASAIDWTTLQ